MRDPRKSFGINLYSYVFSHTAADCVRELADEGYGAFELMMFPGHLWPGADGAAGRRELARAAADRTVDLVSVNMTNVDLNIAGAAREMRDYSLGLISGFIEVAGELGVKKVVIGPGKANPLFPAPREFLISKFYEALDRLCPVAERNGVTLLVENMPFAFLPDADGLVTALDDYGNDDIAVIYDVANGHFIKEDPCEGLRRVKDRLQLVHISDTGQTIYKHDPVGMGDLRFAEVPPVLQEVGYEDLSVLEIISHDPGRDLLESAERLVALGY